MQGSWIARLPYPLALQHVNLQHLHFSIAWRFVLGRVTKQECNPDSSQHNKFNKWRADSRAANFCGGPGTGRGAPRLLCGSEKMPNCHKLRHDSHAAACPTVLSPCVLACHIARLHWVHLCEINGASRKSGAKERVRSTRPADRY